MENPLPPPRVARLRRGSGVLDRYLHVFGLLIGPDGGMRLIVGPRTSPADIAANTAVDLAVRWSNLAWVQRARSDGSPPARQSPVDADAVSAALLISCRACALSLSLGGLIELSFTDGTPLGLVLEGLAPLIPSDGWAIAATTLATRAVWSRIPRWTANSAEGAEDAVAMGRAVAAASAPLPGTGEASAAASPPDLDWATMIGAPLSDSTSDGAHLGPSHSGGAGASGRGTGASSRGVQAGRRAGGESLLGGPTGGGAAASARGGAAGSSVAAVPGGNMFSSSSPSLSPSWSASSAPSSSSLRPVQRRPVRPRRKAAAPIRPRPYLRVTRMGVFRTAQRRSCAPQPSLLEGYGCG